MTKKETIHHLEEKIKSIFAKDTITDIDILIANKHLSTWKKLTNYRPSMGPVLLYNSEQKKK